MGTGKKLFSGKDATGKDTFYVETTDKGVKTYKEATIAEDGTTAGKAKITEGTTDVKMADPLATLDKALSQVDSCVLPWVRYRTVSILLSRT